jgi:hypothetical protein
MKLKLIIAAVGCFFLLYPGPSSAQVDDTEREYYLYLELGQDAVLRGDYDLARDYFLQAQFLRPHEQTATAYLNLLKRKTDGSVFEPEDGRGRPRHDAGPSGHDSVAAWTDDPEESGKSGVSSKQEKLRAGVETRARAAVGKTEPPAAVRPAVVSSQPPEALPARARPEIYLDDDLWARQPRGLIQIILDKAVILDGSHIDRYLDIFPEFVEVSRIDRDRIKVRGVRRGSTILHVWDDRGRWTFQVEVILPFESAPPVVTVRTREEYARPFRFTYTADWSSYSVGRSLDAAKRQSLSFIQTLQIRGETPYGMADGWLVFNKFEESTELTGYGFGLSDGRIGDFDKFTIRGGDTSKTFSPLSMPGQYLRGVRFEKRAFDDKVDFAYVRGKDRATFGFLAPGVLSARESFVEGAKVTLFGDRENNYSFNFARGWGEARPAFLKDEVYSVQVNRRAGFVYFETELAHDNDSLAGTVKTTFDENDRYDLKLNFRNIEEDFTTITNLPSNRGEIGGGFNLGWDWGDVHWNHNVDIYRDRIFFNPDNENALNLDASSYMDYRVSDTDRWTASVFYVDTPGELSPRRNLRLFSNYAKRFDWWERRPLTLTAGAGYQLSRFDLSPVSDFDRKMLTAGLRLPLYRRLDYFLNYEFSWVDEKNNPDHTPGVLTSGLSYSHPFNDRLRGNASVTYRDEQNTDGLNSFLAGEDSLAFHLGLNYRPMDDTEFFADGRVRNVWREGSDSASFHEIDTRWGVRSSWDLPARWNPAGVVYGTVYKDLNANRKRDADEPGVAGVVVKVGEQTITTNQNGHYFAEVRAKSVSVGLDIQSLPRGFVAGTPWEDTVPITAHRWHAADFGVSTQSGIYGIVYYDVNGNGQPDPGDVFIQRVRLSLDGVETAQSDFDGTYFFRDLKSGEYTLTIDVNTLPVDYIPLVKLRQPVKIEEGATYVFHVPVRKKR